MAFATTTTTTSTVLPMSSTSYGFADVGNTPTDMNKYDLPLEVAINEWTAELKPANAMQEEGVFLGVKSKKEYFVDTLSFGVVRRAGNGGLGLGLLEVAGGREDGLGIVIVDEVIAGGNSEGSGIKEGDSIAKLTRSTIKKGAVSKNADGALTETEESVTVGTECLGYDKMVDEIMSLPPPPEEGEEDDVLIVTVKRLRRKPKVTVTLQYPPYQDEPDVVIELFSGENLRRAMLTRGVKLNDSLSRRFDSGGMGDCGAEGTCATCVVSITRGEDIVNPQNIQEQQILAKNPKWRLACRAIIGHGMKEGSMTIRVNPRQWEE
jgi:ferredoxin